MIRGVILDLDGTVYLGQAEVPGASAFVARCHAAGIRCLFVTNRANRTPAEVAEQLRGFGMPCGPADVLTSAQATARVLPPGRAFCIGEAALLQALTEAGFTICEERPDYVIVGLDRTFTYEKLARACSLIGAGARFVATNPDRALKLATGVMPGTGAIVAAVEAGSGQAPLVIGKPGRLIMDMALAVLGTRPEETLVVGDNLVTDIPAGAAAGMPTALILTGVSRREDLPAAPVAPNWVVAGFDELWTVISPT